MFRKEKKNIKNKNVKMKSCFRFSQKIKLGYCKDVLIVAKIKQM